MTSGTRVDLHVKVLDEAVVRRAKRRGLDALVYAPHFTRWPTIQKRARQYSDEDLLVVPGREIFTGDWRTRRHVLALDLERPIPDFVTLEGAMAELESQDAVLLVPHPGFLTVSFNLPHVRQYRDQIDAVEVFNPKHLPWNNRTAREIVEETGLPPFTSSYAHLKRTVGEAWTTFEDPVPDAETLCDLLRDGAPRRVERRSGLRHTARRALEFAHLGWENSWEKFDRLWLSGTEPTHPGHVAYGGEYDDIRVY